MSGHHGDDEGIAVPPLRRVAIPGARGRMGDLLVQGVLESEDLRLVAASETERHSSMGRDVGLLCGKAACGVTLVDDLAGALLSSQAEILIDFTIPELTAKLAAAAAAAGCNLVIGTTGLNADQRAAIEVAAQEVAVVFAPNMSLGVNVLLELVATAAQLLGPDFDLEIVETHHKHKRDAPSGTALRIAEALAAATEAQGSLDARACYGRHGVDPRHDGQIAIHTLRGGDVAGDHTVHFLGNGERLEITHRATSRETFARGALRAARWVADKPPGLYTMRDVLGLS